MMQGSVWRIPARGIRTAGGTAALPRRFRGGLRRLLRWCGGIGLALLLAPLPALAEGDLLPATPVRVIEGGVPLGLRHPSSVAESSDGQLLVLDGVSNRVVVYDRNGAYQYSFGRGGSGEEELNHPLGLALDARDNVYIADAGNARVQVYRPDGRHIEQIPLPQSAQQKRPDPTDVAIDNARQLLYVIDNENHQLRIYSLQQRKFLRTLGGMSHKQDGFRWPFSLYTGPDGTLYIVDVINTRIRTLLPDEGFAFGHDIGGWGVEKGELFRPKGVAVNHRGEVFIADSYLGVIQKFDNTGRFRAVLSDGRGRVRRFTTPTRLYFDRRGLLYVVEMFANRVGVYRLGSK